MVKIRLRRMGSRHRPFYRVVVSDSRKVPSSRVIEELGHYDPRKDPAVISLKTDRIDHWVEHGAQVTNTVRGLVRRAAAAAES